MNEAELGIDINQRLKRLHIIDKWCMENKLTTVQVASMATDLTCLALATIAGDDKQMLFAGIEAAVKDIEEQTIEMWGSMHVSQ